MLFRLPEEEVQISGFEERVSLLAKIRVFEGSHLNIIDSSGFCQHFRSVKVDHQLDI